jgi:hypothetical protein
VASQEVGKPTPLGRVWRRRERPACSVEPPADVCALQEAAGHLESPQFFTVGRFEDEGLSNTCLPERFLAT